MPDQVVEAKAEDHMLSKYGRRLTEAEVREDATLLKLARDL
jgi:hypothetical protein